MSLNIRIERCNEIGHPGWLDLRATLWPDATSDEHREYMAMMLTQPERFITLVAHDERGQPLGFLEGSIRGDYVNGTTTSPVGFIEGVFVRPESRGRGIARALFDSVADWARSRGCRELASDALLDNVTSHRMHLALGFRETERVVYFARSL